MHDAITENLQRVAGKLQELDVVDGAPENVQAYLAAEFRNLLGSRAFLDSLSVHLLPDDASQARASIILDRLQRIANGTD